MIIVQKLYYLTSPTLDFYNDNQMLRQYIFISIEAQVSY